MEYTSPRCSVCHRNTDRSPLRKVAVIGEIVIKGDKKQPDKTIPRILYQCSTCGAVFVTNGELHPTQNPLEEVPLNPDVPNAAKQV